MRRSVFLVIAIVAVLVAGLAGWQLRRSSPAPAPTIDLASTTYTNYATSVQGIFDRRCVPCHACYDSPCQLTLQSFEGVDRGANQSIVYYPQRAFKARPTRMFQDAQSTERWRSEFGFYPVVDRRQPDDLSQSLLWTYVVQRVEYPGGTGFDVDATHSCPKSAEELRKELVDNPERGMPFGFPALSITESSVIAAWLRDGANGPAPSPEAIPSERAEIAKWEAFLNGDDPRMQLVAAYLFEHLFYAHLYFDAIPGAWFRIVRSRTAGPGAIDEIATRRPYDDPGQPRVYYRLRKIRETPVLKTHVPYLLNDQKLARLHQIFLQPAWTAPAVAPYDRDRAANPFRSFAAIPALARYQFLLDDAHYHVQAFIHGPVCRGQAALDVIDEHFLIFFLDPGSDPAITDPQYLAGAADDLALPAEDDGNIEAMSPLFAARDLKYLSKQAPRVTARSTTDIWHGDGTNRGAVLSVFRHFDNAFVVRGAVGGMPKTAWVMDYAIFERMYYNLVAGFDVYGNVAHQLGTRIYMNLLRIESEGQFLRLLPRSARVATHDQWYRNRVARALADMHSKAFAGPEPKINYEDPANAKQELITQLLRDELPAAVVGTREPIQWPELPVSTDPSRSRVELAMRELVRKPAPYVAAFPDTSLLRITTSVGTDLVYTIARNRAHKSVEFIFLEDVELEPNEDTLQILPGIVSGRPNLFFSVAETDLDAFVRAWKALKAGDSSWPSFVARYAVRRSDPKFWTRFDFFQQATTDLDPIGGAVLDLSRYTND